MLTSSIPENGTANYGGVYDCWIVHSLWSVDELMVKGIGVLNDGCGGRVVRVVGLEVEGRQG